MAVDSEILDEIEAAELLDCEPSTVQEKARQGKLPAVKYGRSWRIPRSALMASLHAEGHGQPSSNKFACI